MSLPKPEEWPLAPLANTILSLNDQRASLAETSMLNSVPSVDRGIVVRCVLPDDPAYSAALHLALSWPRGGGSLAATERTAEFHDDNHRRGIRAEVFVAADADRRPLSAILTLHSPGRAALLVLPTVASGRRSAVASEMLLRTAVSAAWESPIQLLQVLLPPKAENARRMVQAVGFRFLTTLIYLERPVWTAPPVDCPVDNDLCWVTYTPDHESLFCAAVQATYSQSLDCPELTGTRDIAEVLAGHRAAGDFHPALWSLALRRNVPVGVVLLSYLPRQRACEVAYMGVALEGRGGGIGRALMQRAAQLSISFRALALTLAVDQRNLPARRLYARCGFEPYAERAAFIATPCTVEACNTNHK